MSNINSVKRDSLHMYVHITVVIDIVFIAPENSVRLVDGPNAYSGRVEVYINGTWGIVCDDQWNLNAGHVVCRQLGFSKAISIHHAGAFGTGIKVYLVCKHPEVNWLFEVTSYILLVCMY